MLQAFWEDLLQNNKGRTCYFHNFGGYDAILSMPPLLELSTKGFSFTPVVKNGEVMSISIRQNREVILVIKDSVKILPGALGKLAKDSFGK
jgi:DNA polymerase type B, organellar and viral